MKHCLSPTQTTEVQQLHCCSSIAALATPVLDMCYAIAMGGSVQQVHTLTQEDGDSNITAVP